MTKSVTELIGETSSYDKKREVERGKPKSWLKSVSSFANGGGGMLIFGISDDGAIVGLKDVQGDAEFVSEVIKAKLDPVPSIDLSIQSEDGKDLVLLNVRPGSETPYYYIGDGQRLAFVRIGNESVVADRVQLKQLVLKGSGATYDRLEIFSPGGMCDGREIQKLDFSTVASKRRNPLLADFFSRLGFMERRGSGLSKIMDAYCAYERFAPVRRPEFVSDSTEFRITMWNINYNLENAKWNCIKENADCTKGGYDSVHEKIHGQLDEKRENKQFCEGGYSAEKFCAKGSSHVENNGDDCIKDLEHCIKDLKKRKAFIQATRKLYHSIEINPKICVKEMAESLNLSVRQIQYHLKTLQMLNKVARIGGRKLGEWKIIDKDYVTGFGE